MKNSYKSLQRIKEWNGLSGSVHYPLNSLIRCSDTIEAMEIPKGFKQTEIGVIPKDWEVKTLKDIAPLQRGFDLPNSKLMPGKYPVVYSNGVMNYHHQYKVKAPGVITGRSGTIGNVHYVTEDYWPHNTSLWVTDFKGNNPLFIYYLFLSIKLTRFSSGSGVPTTKRHK